MTATNMSSNFGGFRCSPPYSAHCMYFYYRCGEKLRVWCGTASDMRNYKLILCGIILVFAVTLKSGE